MDKKEAKELIVVAGVQGSGRTSFAKINKNSFLKSLPLVFDPEEASRYLLTSKSFVSIISLTNDSHQALLEFAKKFGYKVTIYYLFAGKTLSLQRCRFKTITDGVVFDQKVLKKEYEKSHQGLISAYSKADLIFLIKNQKKTEFVAAFDSSSGTKEQFSLAVKQLKAAVDDII